RGGQRGRFDEPGGEGGFDGGDCQGGGNPPEGGGGEGGSADSVEGRDAARGEEKGQEGRRRAGDGSGQRSRRRRRLPQVFYLAGRLRSSVSSAPVRSV